MCRELSFLFQAIYAQKALFVEFIIRFNGALGRQSQKKVVGDHNDKTHVPPLQLRTPMEAQMAKLYTRFMFEKFQVEKMKNLTYFLREKSGDGIVALYEVLERIGWVTKMKGLVIDMVSSYAKCNCKGKGITFSFDAAH
ncbi:hypothetical protein ACFX2F_025746 [Malus domestica]